MSQLKVQKYGGATLATPEKIQIVAKSIADQVRQGKKILAVVSAMGKTTNDLIDLAKKVAKHPSRRELDMLLTTGERISMALLTMALEDLGIRSVSFTGSQAGIMTDDAHVNASIIDVKSFRIDQALAAGKVVVLAGFQGVSPLTKEITTLGRGGSDTTAVALATYLKCECEILKEVAGVHSADPNVVSEAKLLDELSYEHLIDMTFWGAKVLHSRSAVLAMQNQIPLLIGSVKAQTGTLIKRSLKMYESNQIIAVNAHENVLALSTSFHALNDLLTKHEIAPPQVLLQQNSGHVQTIWLTGPQEVLAAIESLGVPFERHSSLTATCRGPIGLELQQKMLDELTAQGAIPSQVIVSPLSMTFIVQVKGANNANRNLLEALHSLIED